MPTNYSAIEKENRERYGWDIERIGKMLLADRYDDRTHFLYELLQNAEDAIRWRPAAAKHPKSVFIKLESQALEFSHYGLPFEEKHVRGICGVGESTKEGDLTAIGRFGIGFKSVYAFANRPEIHSGNEHFAIEAFVRPCQTRTRPTSDGQTIFRIPFDVNATTAFEEIQARLDSMGHRTLIFLKNIESIDWESPSTGGNYIRESKPIQEDFRKVTILGQRKGETSTEMEKWLAFSRDVKNDDKPAGQVEIAYSLSEDPDTKQEIIVPIADSRLVVFFPTIVATHLGFLIQGPYRTTPSRDNIPKDDPWNRYLISETAKLVQESLAILRDRGFLSVSVLNAMPLEREKFQGPLNLARLEHMCMPIFKAVRQSLLNDDLLPKYGGGHASGKNVKIARTDGLRKLLSPSQIAQLYSSPSDLFWLTEEITRDKTAQLRQYLIGELAINEIDPESLHTRFTEDFIKKQSDEWVAHFYSFLLDQPALWRTGGFRLKPILRLETGAHVTPFGTVGHPRAFLPTEAQSGFPQVKRSLCQDPLALKFLKQLGLTTPDPVDDVIYHVVPTFTQSVDASLPLTEYRDSFQRILAALQTDSTSQREKLVSKLKQTPFLRCRNAATSQIEYRLPESAYFATDKLTTLFIGIPVIWFLDDQFEAHRGELPRKLLEACGVRDYLRRVEIPASLTDEDKAALRLQKGASKCSRENESADFDVAGLRASVEAIATLPPHQAVPRALNLWQVLLDTLREARDTFFQGWYGWGFHREDWNAYFPAQFLRDLRQIPWLPAADGTLKAPISLRFTELPDTFRVASNATLQDLLGFKPEVIQQLAQEAGIDPGSLDLLKKHGLTSEKLLELLRQAGMEAVPSQVGVVLPTDTPHQGGADTPTSATNDTEANLSPTDEPPSSESNSGGGGSHGSTSHHTKHPQAGEFITYVYTAPAGTEASDKRNSEADAQRKKRGQAGVEVVLAYERAAGRTPEAMPQTNEGYDVVSRNAAGEIVRYIEVKTPGEQWGQRGVTLSQPQFEAAQTFGDNFWLYVVEDVGKPTHRIYRVQDPAQRTKHFAFNNGWRALAEPDSA